MAGQTKIRRDDEQTRLFYTPILLQQKTKVFIREGVAQSEQTVTLELINNNPFPVKIYSGTRIGVAETIKRIETKTYKYKIGELEIKEEHREIYKQIDEITLNEDKALSTEQEERLRQFLKKYVDIIAGDPKNPGTNLKVKHNINTGDNVPIKQRAHRLSQKEQEIEKKEVINMKQNNIIRDSKSPWTSPVVLVRKKDETTRFCIDYRKLNAITKKDVYPMPRVDDTLEKLAGMKLFTTLDLASGYWQVEVEEKDKEKTAFICSLGLFEFNVMPFGLCNAPATFQRMMDEVLSGLKDVVGRDYIDDLIIGSKGFEEHLEHLTKIFNRLREYKLKIKLNKCLFAKKKVLYLGHEISEIGISPNPEKIEAINKMKPPKDISGLRRFLGLTSYYRRFIKGYARIAQPLNTRLKKGKIYNWDQDCQQAFDELKKKLISKPILEFSDFSKPFYIHTDASNFGIGAVLTQRDEDNKERVISYLSRTQSKAERKYTVTEKECLAVVWAIGKLRHYIYRKKFYVITDHAALKWLMNIKDPNGRLSRWGLKLQELEMEVIHRAGALHRDADAMSRIDEENIIRKIRTDNNQQYEEVKVAQRRNEELRPIILYLKTQELIDKNEEKNAIIIMESSAYELIDGLLYRVLPINKTKKEEIRLVIPSTMKEQILRDFHNAKMSGHFGINKTYFKIRERYYWKNMYKDVKQWVSQCFTCNARKGRPDSKIGEMMTFSSKERMELLSVDIVGRLPKTFKGNKYILVCTDHFSRWVEAFPIKDDSMITIAKKIVEEVICRYGVPKKILSDKGTNFTGSLITQIMEQMGIQKITTTAYHPQTNGVVERFNKTFKDMLAMYTSTHLKDWDNYIPYLLFAY